MTALYGFAIGLPVGFVLGVIFVCAYATGFMQWLLKQQWGHK